jgi:hypothetical protein
MTATPTTTSRPRNQSVFQNARFIRGLSPMLRCRFEAARSPTTPL